MSIDAMLGLFKIAQLRKIDFLMMCLSYRQVIFQERMARRMVASKNLL